MDILGTFINRVLLPTLHASVLVLSLLILSVAIFLRPQSRKKGYPPGPSTFSILCHKLHSSVDKPWIHFNQLGKKYGPIVNVSFVGDKVLVLNRAEDAEELLTQRSQNYSSRKPIIFTGRYKSNNRRIVLLPHGPELCKQRAAYQIMLQPNSEVDEYHDKLKENKACDLLLKIINHPQDVELNMNRYAASIIYTLACGKQLKDDDEELNAILGFIESFIADCLPGAYLVNTFPVLDYLPGFLAPWRNEGRMKYKEELEFYSRFMFEVKDKIDRGSDPTDCFARRLWENHANLKLDFESLTFVICTAIEAGTDKPAASLMWFIMAMLIHPECMRRAQEEIDSVLGADGETMPGFAHMDALPYCFALTKEVFRWRPATPLSFPHYSEEDDVYKGYKIKANTTIIPNVWAMHQDEDRYPDPSVFNPLRFFEEGPSVIDTRRSTNPTALTKDHYTFGFGRRICPGKHLGSKVVWIAIVRILWAFNITHEVDATGEEIPVDPHSSTLGILSKPQNFPVRFSVRSNTRIETIRREQKLGES